MTAVENHMTDFHRRMPGSRIFGICLGLSIALHAVLLALMGYGLRPDRAMPPVKKPPLQVVLLPPPPKPATVPTPPPPRKPANPLPPSPAPHVARQTIKTPKTTQTRHPHPVPVPKPRIQARPKPAPRLHLVAKPDLPRPSHALPGKSSVALKPAEAPQHTLTTPSPAPTVPDAPAGGVAPDAGQGTGSEGAGTGSESGTGSGAASGTGGNGAGGGGGSAPYWPFGMDTGDAGGGGPRHVVYILDISASMESRIAQARREIAAAIDSLQSGETFDIVAFDERGQSFRSDLVPATSANIRDAKDYLNDLQLGPGTNLEAALKIALKIPGANVIVLVTDGVPTVGEQSWRKLEKLARDLNRGDTARIYAIGLVGKNPDGTDDSFEATKLLQKLSADSGGKSTIYSLGVATPQ